MNDVVEGQVVEREFSPDVGALGAVVSAEVDKQIATAKRFPRSVTKFQSEAISLVSLNEEMAESCVYAIPRDGKTIEGPSARFAEVVLYSWGNCRAAARVVSEEGDFVTAQGIYWDQEKNTTIGYEVKRRIVDSRGKRYKPDMIGVTANAACSIALRNAILKGIPKAIWAPAYDKARATIMGDFETLANRRTAALASFQKFGVKPEQIFEKLDVKGEEDISLEHILTLRGLLTAIREGDTTVEETFAPKPSDKGGVAGLKEKHGIGQTHQEAPAAAPGEAPAAEAPKDGGKPTQDAPQPDPKAKKAGTPKLRKAFVERFGKATAEELDVAYDETRGYIWGKEDEEALREAYEEGKGRLAS